jgi:hypothetical protein
MVKHEPALMAFIVRKQMRLIMYVLRWQQMSAMPKTLGKAGKTKSILLSFPTLPSVEEEALGKEFFLNFFLCRVFCSGAPERYAEGHSAKRFSKKNFFLCRVPGL